MSAVSFWAISGALALMTVQIRQEPTSTSESVNSNASPRIERVLIESRDSNSAYAYVFLPPAEGTHPEIVFSHSKISFPDTTVDLKPMGAALASSGAAVIMLDRTMDFPPSSDVYDGWDVLVAAEQWLIKHADIDRSCMGYVGPRIFNPEINGLDLLPYPHNLLTGPFVHIPIGTQATTDITNSLRSDEGRLKRVQFLVKHLHLKK